MKTILTFNDNSSASAHAARFALVIAQSLGANVLLATTCALKKSTTETVLIEDRSDNIFPEKRFDNDIDDLNVFDNKYDGFKPELIALDVSHKNEDELIELINKEHIWMIVKGISSEGLDEITKVNVNRILNRVQCPLLLVPDKWMIKSIERIVYLADLRYCRIKIVRYLEELAKPFNADVSIANFSARGLPNMADDYALSVFSDEISCYASYDRLLLNNVKEKNVETAIDIIINGLHNDMLAIVNHRFHFEEILGRYITNKLPDYVTIPLIVFPY